MHPLCGIIIEEQTEEKEVAGVMYNNFVTFIVQRCGCRMLLLKREFLMKKSEQCNSEDKKTLHENFIRNVWENTHRKIRIPQQIIM